MDRYATLRNRLVGAWCPSLGATGYTLLDRSGRRSNGTLVNGSGVAWVGSGSGTSVEFSGTGYANLGSSPAIQPSVSGAGMTLSVWIYRTANLQFAGNCLIWAKPNATFSGNGFYVELAASAGSAYPNTPLVVFDGFPAPPNASFMSGIQANTAFALNTWTHVAFTVKNTSVQWYLNGVPQTTTTTGTPSITATNDTKYLFFNSPGYGSYTPCRWDDFRIYSRDITNPEIQLLASRRGIGLLPTRHRRGSLLSQFWTKVSGTWKTATPWINVGGTWKKGTPKIRAGGAWKG